MFSLFLELGGEDSLFSLDDDTNSLSLSLFLSLPPSLPPSLHYLRFVKPSL
jgi:hypothetical protein